ncbi:helix-turn-helix transcriptional regulator [Corynebacterium sp. HS2168-gen11]|uniref:helix-turn-helix domain-containing protein n=1 Tax=Corynebacterium sp. HS2168-gen11 TaxID=2974027 RepID=UPI00216B448E|nr:helix-turn-helix transcriptional regulator [Corynebacterium sp. HS2168-gen11]MCS4535419.1 helix-turn-helix domain-containing protein [Corynebacterium sp. HS2168-gen11]
MSTWQEKTVANIGKKVQQARGDRSLQWVEQRTEQLGFKVGRGALSRLENGKRESISVAEWLTLAAALELPPSLLLFPQYPYGDTEYLPEKNDSAYNAAQWVGGNRQFQNDKIVKSAHLVVSLAQQLEELKEHQLNKLLEFMRTPHVGGEDELLDEFVFTIQQRINEIKQTLIELTGEENGNG